MAVYKIWARVKRIPKPLKIYRSATLATDLTWVKTSWTGKRHFKIVKYREVPVILKYKLIRSFHLRLLFSKMEKGSRLVENKRLLRQFWIFIWNKFYCVGSEKKQANKKFRSSDEFFKNIFIYCGVNATMFFFPFWSSSITSHNDSTCASISLAIPWEIFLSSFVLFSCLLNFMDCRWSRCFISSVGVVL